MRRRCRVAEDARGVLQRRTVLDAAAVGERLEQELGASVRTIAATGGKPLTLERFPWRQGLEWDERDPVDALVAASHEADLLIVGSRGLHGMTALGSVSERVAHRAACSVLVVRPRAERRSRKRPAAAEARA